MKRDATLLLLSAALVAMLAVTACIPETFVDWRALNKAGVDAMCANDPVCRRTDSFAGPVK